MFNKAENLAAKFIAYLLKQKNWGIDRVSKHQDYSGKYCPHKTLDLGWERFLNLIRVELGEEVKVQNTTVGESQTVQNRKIDVKYQVYANAKWLPDVTNLTDYAGILGQGINCFRRKYSADKKQM